MALLTTISEGGRNTPLPLDSLLEKRLVSKIRRLSEALDLPCRGSCGPIDKVHAKPDFLVYPYTPTASMTTFVYVSSE
jgi:hypothetical protein